MSEYFIKLTTLGDSEFYLRDGLEKDEAEKFMKKIEDYMTRTEVVSFTGIKSKVVVVNFAHIAYAAIKRRGGLLKW